MLTWMEDMDTRMNAGLIATSTGPVQPVSSRPSRTAWKTRMRRIDTVASAALLIIAHVR